MRPALQPTVRLRPAPPNKRFTLTFAAALALGLGAAVVISPVAAMAVMAAGWRFPFPRIFDRTVMITLAVALLLFARPLRLVELISNGFARARGNLARALAGLAIALAAIALLFALTAVVSGHLRGPAILAGAALKYLPGAILIALIEESFFRAFLLGGFERDFGALPALLLSSAIFSIVHLLRSPARYYLYGFHPAAGADNLAASAARIAHPGALLPTIVGLFLLGLMLGEAYLLTRRVYFSLGLHAGFVVGAKAWRHAADGTIPRWIAGPGPVPLIAAPAAWAISLLLLGLLPLGLAQFGRPRPQQSYTGGVPRGRVR